MRVLAVIPFEATSKADKYYERIVENIDREHNKIYSGLENRTETHIDCRDAAFVTLAYDCRLEFINMLTMYMYAGRCNTKLANSNLHGWQTDTGAILMVRRKDNCIHVAAAGNRFSIPWRLLDGTPVEHMNMNAKSGYSLLSILNDCSVICEWSKQDNIMIRTAFPLFQIEGVFGHANHCFAGNCIAATWSREPCLPAPSISSRGRSE